MAENTQTPEQPDANTDEQKVPFTTKLAIRYPRATKVAVVTVSAVAVVGSAVIAITVVLIRKHVIEAGVHAKEALSELESAVSPTDTEA